MFVVIHGFRHGNCPTIEIRLMIRHLVPATTEVVRHQIPKIKILIHILQLEDLILLWRAWCCDRQKVVRIIRGSTLTVFVKGASQP